ncbi:Zn-dependent alcohol dehydrogenase [Paraglaciecola polaris]|uniref:Zn-dependent alcohol dehydrogenase n=1 Tax=Paraglaciecola polaris TaxID=222814 RepID=UPI0030EC7A8E|tara:strand:- start:12890 stop:14008 length:1119 start_codon:yes stop_codon:yes gene_type:complete
MKHIERQSKAIVSNGKGHYELVTLQVAPPDKGEVRVKILASGLCHTDWDSIQNWNKTFVVGHEGAGIVDAIGDDVAGLSVGDKVILNWCIPCGHCFACQQGNVHICENNSPVCGNGLCGHANDFATTLSGKAVERSFHLGTLSEYTVVKAAAIVKFTHEIPFSSASIVGCGVMTGYGSVVNAAQVKAGSTVCVIGCGGVGLNVIQAARISGARKIIAIDINQDRLDQAKAFGATHGLISINKDVDFAQMRALVNGETQGRGADYAFECTAIPALGSAPLALIRNAGVAVQVSGIEQRVDFNCELFEWDKTYINPLYGKCNPQADFPILLDLYNSGQLKLDELVSKTYSLENVANGFDDMLNGRVAKAVVVFE